MPTSSHAPAPPTAPNGPDNWATLDPLYADCGVSGQQSPVAIITGSIDDDLPVPTVVSEQRCVVQRQQQWQQLSTCAACTAYSSQQTLHAS